MKDTRKRHTVSAQEEIQHLEDQIECFKSELDIRVDELKKIYVPLINDAKYAIRKLREINNIKG